MQLLDTLLQSQHSLDCFGIAWSGAHPVCGLGWMCTSLVYAATGAKDSGEAPLRLCCMTPFAGLVHLNSHATAVMPKGHDLS